MDSGIFAYRSPGSTCLVDRMLAEKEKKRTYVYIYNELNWKISLFWIYIYIGFFLSWSLCVVELILSDVLSEESREREIVRKVRVLLRYKNKEKQRKRGRVTDWTKSELRSKDFSA